jgi:hypothetical protein
MSNCKNTHTLVTKTLGSVTTRTWIKLSDGSEETDPAVLALLEASLTDLDTCEDRSVHCTESQEWTYAIDNTGTTTNEDAQVIITLSDGSEIIIDQTDQGAVSQWTPQMAEWGTNIQQAVDDAGIKWFVETRYIAGAGSLAGGGGFSGPPTVPVSNALWAGGIRARYVNIQICPGQPVPVSARYVSASRDIQLTSAGAVLGPVQKFFVCRSCGDEPVWYLEDGITLAEPGQIPNCYEPCGTLALTDAPPDRDCEFFFDLGCDSNNQTDPANFTQQITRRATVCSGEQIAVDYYTEDPNDPSALIDHTLVGDFVDCDTGAVIDEPVDCDPEQLETEEVCVIDPDTPIGINGLRWDSEGNATDWKPNSQTFPEWNVHENGAPDEQVLITNNWSLTDSDFPATGTYDPAGGDRDISSQELYYAYIYVDRPMLLNDNNGNTGEYLTFLREDCNGDMLPVKNHYSSSGNGGMGDITELPVGIHKIAIQVNDYSAFGGFNLRYSVDGGATYQNFPISQTFAVRPQILKQCVSKCRYDGKLLNPDCTEFTGTIIDCDIPCSPMSRDPLDDVEVNLVDGCDDIDGDPANYVPLTREVIFINGEKQTPVYYDDYANDGVYANQDPNFVDCATGEPIEEPVVSPDCEDIEITTAFAPFGENGVNVERWITNAATGLPSGTVPADVFDQPSDYSGMPAHQNGAPDSAVVESDFRILDGNSGQDQFRAWTYIYIAEPMLVRDRASYAEATEHFVGECGADPISVNVAEYTGLDQNDQLLVNLPAGIHYLGVEVFDFSAWSGVDLQYSLDNGDTWTRLPASWLYTQKPTLKQCPVKVCFKENGSSVLTDLNTGLPLGPEFTTCKPDLCTPIAVAPETPTCQAETFYRVGFGEENGVAVEYWGDNAATHDDTEVTFPDADFFTHVNGASDGTGVHADWSMNDVNVASDAGANNVSADQFLAHGYIYMRAGGYLRDINTNTGERMSFWTRQCGGALEKVYTSPSGDDSAWANGSRGLFGDGDPARPEYYLPAGLHWVGFQVNDNSSSSGIQLQVNYGDGFVNFPAEDSYPVKPTIECIKGWRCDDGTYWNSDKSEELDPDTISCEKPESCEPATVSEVEVNNLPVQTLCTGDEGYRVEQTKFLIDYYELSGITGNLRNQEWSDVRGDGTAFPNAERNAEDANNFLADFDYQNPDIDNTRTDLDTNETDNTGVVADLQLISGTIVVDKPLTVRWTGTSEGYIRVDIAPCCGSDYKTIYQRVHPSDDPYPVTIPKGVHNIRIYNLDMGGSNSSQSFQITNDGQNWIGGSGALANIQLSQICPNEELKKGFVCGDQFTLLDGSALNLSDPNLSLEKQPCTPSSCCSGGESDPTPSARVITRIP